MRRLPSWTVSDAFWQRVKPLLPQPTRDPGKTYIRKKGGGRKPLDYRKVFEALSMFFALAYNGKLFRKRFTAVPVPSMPIFGSGKRPEFFWPCGEPGWLNMMKWRAYPGCSKVLIAP